MRRRYKQVLLEQFLKPEPKWIAAEVKGAKIFAPDGTSIIMSGNPSQDLVRYILERKIFDRAIAINAFRACTEVFVKTMAVGLLKKMVCPAAYVLREREYSSR